MTSMSFFGFSRGSNIIDCNGLVTNSSVTNSSIDMNGGVITSHGTPLNGTDVVNKDYVDNNALIPVATVNLLSTVYSTIINIQSGSIIVLVKNVVSDGPAATFLLSKNEPSREASVFRMTSSDGVLSQEKLEIRWFPSTGIEIRKTGVNYDGQYKVKYIIM